MTDHDPRLRATLDRLVPRPAAQPPAWQDLLREAAAAPPRRFRWPSTRLKGSRPRLLVPALAVVATALVAIPALALSRDWWFLGTGTPQPASQVAVLEAGRAAGIDWTLTSYLSKDKGVCVALTLDVGQRDTGSLDCGADVRGEPTGGSSAGRARHWVGSVYYSLGLYDFPDFVYGLAAEGVDRVDVVLSDGQTLRTPTLDGPTSLPVAIDFYAVPLPAGGSVKSVIARDRSGTALETRACRACSRPGVGSSS